MKSFKEILKGIKEGKEVDENISKNSITNIIDEFSHTRKVKAKVTNSTKADLLKEIIKLKGKKGEKDGE